MEEVLDGGSEEEIAEQGNGGFFLKGKLGFLEIFCFSHHRLHSIGQSINVTSSFFRRKLRGTRAHLKRYYEQFPMEKKFEI